MQYLGTVSKIVEWSWFISRSNHPTSKWSQVYAPTTDAKEAEVDRFCEDLQHLLELTPKQCLFHHRRLKCKSRKSRDSQNNRQVWPCGTKWSKAKVNRILSREHAGHSKCPFPTTQKITLHMYISRWSTLKSDYCVACSLDRETLHSQQRNSGADCGSDHTLLMAKLKKVSGKNHQATQVWPKSNPLWLCSGSDE